MRCEIKGTVTFTASTEARNAAANRRSVSLRARREGLTLSLGLAVLAAACSSKPVPGPASAGWYSETRELYFGIPVSVRFTPRDDELAARVWRKLERVDDVFNIYRPDSEVSRVNGAREPKALEVSLDLARALELSRRVHEETGGAFDVTVGGLVALWKEAAKTGRMPSADGIAEARALAGMIKHYKISDSSLIVDPLFFVTPGATFDFGGIVKGMAVDDAIAALKEAGCTAALVQVGGETGAYGMSPRGRPHVIGVQNPLNPLNPLQATDIWTAVGDPGTGISVATSGNYQQPIVIGGKVFYHIIDPRTGRPVDTHTLSVTVAFPETGKNGLADGLSTAGAVLGAEQAIPIIEKLGGEALFLVRTDGGEVREVKSGGWDALVYESARRTGN